MAKIVDNLEVTGSLLVNGVAVALSGQGGGGSSLANVIDSPNGNGTGVILGDISTNYVSGGFAVAEGYKTTANGFASHAEGYDTTASGPYSHAEGYDTTASGNGSHAEGYTRGAGKIIADGLGSHAEGFANGGLEMNIASGAGSHVEGRNTTASGDYSHAEGFRTTASGWSPHAEGDSTIAYGYASHAEGARTEAYGWSSHAEGYRTIASGYISHAEGNFTRATSFNSHAEGANTEASGQASHAEGDSTIADGEESHAEGTFTRAYGDYGSHAEGNNTLAFGNGSHAEGFSTSSMHISAGGIGAHAEGHTVGSGKIIADGDGSHAEGFVNNGEMNIASGRGSHAEGRNTTAISNYYGGYGGGSHAEGYKSTASGVICHAEGNNTKASGYYSHAEGNNTKALYGSTHAEGVWTIASGEGAHAEGSQTLASGPFSHAEGGNTTASGRGSHAEGNNTSAVGKYAHAEGENTIASGYFSHAEGRRTLASGQASHTEGFATSSMHISAGGFGAHAEGHTVGSGKIIADGNGAHAEGYVTTGETNLAEGKGAHAEGRNTTASGTASHAEGRNTTALGIASHAGGQGAYAKDANTFVWSDSTPFQSTQAQTFNIYATNGVNISGGDLTVAGNIIPSLDSTYSLGTSAQQWKDLHVSENTIYVGGTPITVSDGKLEVRGEQIATINDISGANIVNAIDSQLGSSGWQSGGGGGGTFASLSDNPRQNALLAEILSGIDNRIGENFLRDSINDGRIIHQLVNGFVDEFEDQSGIDLVSSANQNYNGEDDNYSSLNTAFVTLLIQSDNEINGSQVFTDEVGARIVTPTGNTQHSTSAPIKWGTSKILFDGTGGLAIPQDPLLNLGGTGDEFTIAFWFNTSYTASSQMLVTKIGGGGNDTIYTRLQTNGTIQTVLTRDTGSTMYNQTTSGHSALNDGNWHYYKLTKDSINNINVYIDGILRCTATSAFTIRVTSVDWMLGQRGDNTSERFYGSMDDFFIAIGTAISSGVPNARTTTGGQNMDLISNAISVSSDPENARFVLLFSDTSSAVLNTDVILSISRDNGVTYSPLTLVEDHNYDSAGILRILSTNIVDLSGQPTGTDIVWKFQALNDVNVKLHAIYGQW